jgi:hypothetical protein
MKSALSKVVGKAMLTFAEFEDTLLDVECFINNRPLVYLGEELEWLAVTPNILVSNLVPRVFLRTARGEGKTLVSAETSCDEI